MKNELSKQLATLSAGTEEILPENGLKEKLEGSLASGEPLVVKLGVDPTAPDLHLGHAVPLRKLRQFQDFGHQICLIIGDFTARIGDPSGRSTTRPRLTPDEVRVNAKTYTDQAFKILDKNKTRLEFNSKWLSRLTLAEILELAGKFTVAGLLVRDDFTSRYQNEKTIGLHEFLYPLMQAYDSVVLKADVEVGGTDQKFNLLAGRELQEKMGQKPQICITLPLLEGTDGVRKMSKSYGNHIGLTFPPEEVFGKVMSIPDEIMWKYFRLATLVPESEISQMEKSAAEGRLHPAEAKRLLSRQVVSLYHGEKAAEEAERIFNARHKEFELEWVSPQSLRLSQNDLKEGKIWIVKLLRLAGFADTNAEGRRLVEQGGVRILRNGQTLPCENPDEDIEVKDDDLIRVGKRKFARIVLL